MDKIAVMNKAREKYRLEYDEKIRQKACLLFENYKDERLFVTGIMLYWAEGTRQSTKYVKYQLALANSDPKLLEVYCNFLRSYFDDIEPELRVALYTYKDIEESRAKSFWSNVLKIPLNQFIKTQVLPSRSVLTETKLPHGTCCVYLNGKEYCYTMQVWIDGMSSIMRG